MWLFSEEEGLWSVAEEALPPEAAFGGAVFAVWGWVGKQEDLRIPEILLISPIVAGFRIATICDGTSWQEEVND